MIIKRIRDIVLAGVHETLDKLEDPVSLLKQYLRDVEQEILNAECTLAQQAVTEKRHAILIEETQVQIAKRARQAQLAVDTGDDEIAKLALHDKLQLESRLAVYTKQLETITSQTALLTEQLRTLQEKYSDMLAKKRFLFARAQAANTQQQLNSTLHEINAESAVRGFARMEERVLMMEARAEASQLVLTNHRKLERLTTDAALEDQVADELAKLKATRTEA